MSFRSLLRNNENLAFFQVTCVSKNLSSCFIFCKHVRIICWGAKVSFDNCHTVMLIMLVG